MSYIIILNYSVSVNSEPISTQCTNILSLYILYILQEMYFFINSVYTHKRVYNIPINITYLYYTYANN